jgi:energy-coupling factor transport system ATP-binding protein
VSFDVPRGGSLLVLGPSGCGKSTLGLCLNGAIPHFVEGSFVGSVRLDGRDTREASMAEMAQRVGVVFQDPEAQFCMLKLEDEVAFGLENLAIPRADMDARIDEALGWVGLADRRTERIENLSGGQKQRLALACVLAQRPEVLVFDEPTAQLDPAGAAEVVALLGRLRQRGHHTLVIIEHRLDDLMPLVDDVLVLNQSGEMVVHGPPRRVLADWGNWLESAGVWVPQVSELATRLSAQGIALDPFPVSVEEAVFALRPLATEIDARRSPDPPAHPARTALVAARDLTFRYAAGAQPALDHVNVEFLPGELTAIVGPNGAGKSTLARQLVHILKPPRETVFLRGRDVRSLSVAEVAKVVGYVFQYPEHQFVGSSVLDDVAYGLRRTGLTEREALRIASEFLVEFGLDRLAAAHPYSLSYGEQRRLSVAAMLALGQQGLFLDEPTFGQDRRNAASLLDKLDALADSGRAIVAITHDMRLVAERAGRSIVMLEGRLVFDGSPLDLFANTELLHRAGLRPPPITEVGFRLGLAAPLLAVDDVVHALDRRPAEVV